jgi:hypothetical protein
MKARELRGTVSPMSLFSTANEASKNNRKEISGPLPRTRDDSFVPDDVGDRMGRHLSVTA